MRIDGDTRYVPSPLPTLAVTIFSPEARLPAVGWATTPVMLAPLAGATTGAAIVIVDAGITDAPFTRSDTVRLTFHPAPDPVLSTTENGSMLTLVSCSTPVSVTGREVADRGMAGRAEVERAAVRGRGEDRARERDRAEQPEQPSHHELIGAGRGDARPLTWRYVRFRRSAARACGRGRA